MTIPGRLAIILLGALLALFLLVVFTSVVAAQEADPPPAPTPTSTPEGGTDPGGGGKGEGDPEERNYPGPPRNLNLTASSAGVFELGFTRGLSTDIHDFELHRAASSSGAYSEVATRSTNSSPVNFGSQDRGYYYKVRGQGCSDDDCSNWVWSNVVEHLPSPPTGLTASFQSTTTGSIRVSYSPGNTSYTNRFTLYRSGSQYGTYTDAGVQPTTSGSSPAYLNLPGRGYWYKVQGQACRLASGSGTGCSTTNYSNSLYWGLETPPQPTGFQATSSGQTSVSLSWNSRTGISRYWVEYWDSGQGQWQTSSQYVYGTSRTVYSLACNQTHYFRVAARGNGTTYAADWGLPTSSVSRQTTTCPDAPVPTGLTVTGSTQNSVSLSWNSVSDAYRYQLERREESSGSWLTVSSNLSATQYRARNLDCGATHYFRVSARGDGSPYSTSFGNPSSSVSRTTTTCPDAPVPTGLTVTGSTQNSVSLSWNSVSDAYRYQLERREGSSGSWLTVSSNLSATQYRARNLECGATHYFRVSARGDGSPYSTSFGNPSSSVSRTTTTCPNAPAPTGLTVTGTTETSISLRWSAVTDAYAYQVERRVSGSAQWTYSGYVYSGTSHTATGLGQGTTYYFRVKTRGDGFPYSIIYGDPSSSVPGITDSTLNAPPAPTGLAPSASTMTGISLSWNRVPGAEKYRLEHRMVNDGQSGARDIQTPPPGPETWTTVSENITGESYPASGLTCGTRYQFRVSAYGNGAVLEASWGEWSDILTAATDPCTPPAPTGLAPSASTMTGISLSWNRVIGAARYWVQRRPADQGSSGARDVQPPPLGPASWTTVGDAITGTGVSDTGLECGTEYEYQVKTYGDGTVLAAQWGEWSAPLTARTTACGIPLTFTSSSYSFTVPENAATRDHVDTVTANDAEGAVSYSITSIVSVPSGHGAGKFTVGSTSGAIQVAGSLNFAIAQSYTLTMQALDIGGNTATATVEITVDPVCQSLEPFVNGTINYTGTWVSNCSSVHRPGKNAYFVSFTLAERSVVRLDLISTVNPYLYLLSGQGRSGTRLAEDNHSGVGDSSLITMELDAGDYTAEATTYLTGLTGSFSLIINASPPTEQAISLVDLVDSVELGASKTFTIASSSLNSLLSYQVDVSTDNGNAKFDQNCTATGMTTSKTIDDQALDNWSVTLWGCAAAGRTTLTATLSNGTSDLATVSQDINVTLPTPVNVTDTAGYDTITLSWDDLPAGVTGGGYELQRVTGTDANPTYQTLRSPGDYDLTDAGTAIEAVIKGLTNGETYSHRVRTLGDANANANSPWTEPIETMILEKLGAPTGLNIIPMPSRRALMTWDPVAGKDENTRYFVQAFFNDSHGTKVWHEEPNITTEEHEIDLDMIIPKDMTKSGPVSFEDVGLAQIAAFQFKVMAKDTSATPTRLDSDYSDEITLVDTPITFASGASEEDDGQIAVEWNTIAGASGGHYGIRYVQLTSPPDWENQLTWRPFVDKSHVRDVEVDWGQSSLDLIIEDDDLSEGTYIYALQLVYGQATRGTGGDPDTIRPTIFSARDAYAWPSADFPPHLSRLATYAFFGHHADQDYDYIICDETFFPEAPGKQSEWVALIEEAMELWEIPDLITATRLMEDCTEAPTTELSNLRWRELLIGNPFRSFLDMVYFDSLETDSAKSEIRMVDFSSTSGSQSAASFPEMWTDPFKVCVTTPGIDACVTSVRDYSRVVRQGSNELHGVDITFNRNTLEAAGYERPSAIRLNSCLTASGSAEGTGFGAYGLAVHEAGHAFGLSDVSLRAQLPLLEKWEVDNGIPQWKRPSNYVDALMFWDDARRFDSYNMSHPTIPDSVLNYNGKVKVNNQYVDEDDCSPHPFDLMALTALYQNAGD